ncbi:MAG TPA: DHH family phosphoesterase [Candidatus Saccharimonadales bacterium]|nr:DHH family phosphoesterase [Candidatus Saccharimonadales bacterium]
MKIVVTHGSPDLDAITSVWLIKKYLPGWQDADVAFVPAGERYKNIEYRMKNEEPIEKVGEDEIIHVDTGLGPLDHHQTNDTNVCAASRVWDFVQKVEPNITPQHKDAIQRIVNVVVDVDHFKEVFWGDPTADYHEFSLLGVLDGLKLAKPNQDSYYVEFMSECLVALMHQFENRDWAEKEIGQNGVEFTTKWGKAIGFETLNDTVIKLAQKMGFVLVLRKDPRKGYVRIKARPSSGEEKAIDLTLAYEKLKKIDPDATWFLHVSKKMLLNGSVKNPKMKATKLSLKELIEVLKSV